MHYQGDFTVDRRLFKIGILALAIGAVCSVIAWVLLNLINLFTNLFFFQTVSFAFRPPAEVLLALGSAHFRNGEPEAAEANWKAALEVNPKYGEAHNNIAVTSRLVMVAQPPANCRQGKVSPGSREF
jgi:tetratricopeptide (TPR) repeat protein